MRLIILIFVLFTFICNAQKKRDATQLFEKLDRIGEFRVESREGGGSYGAHSSGLTTIALENKFFCLLIIGELLEGKSKYQFPYLKNNVNLDLDYNFHVLDPEKKIIVEENLNIVRANIQPYFKKNLDLFELLLICEELGKYKI